MVDIIKNKEKNICQGDIFFPDDSEIYEVLKIEADLPISGFIVVSNSCDIVNESIDYISIAPIIPLQFIIDLIIERKRLKKESQNKTLSQKDIDDIKDKNVKNIMGYNNKLYFFIQENKSHSVDKDSIVLLEMILTYEINKIEKLINEKRTCTLRSPWREKLGWSAGNLYNRVAVKNFNNSDITKVVSNV